MGGVPISANRLTIVAPFHERTLKSPWHKKIACFPSGGVSFAPHPFQFNGALLIISLLRKVRNRLRRLSGQVERSVQRAALGPDAEDIVHIDAVEGHPLPILLVRGWTNSARDPEILLETETGQIRAPDYLFREPRPDVVNAGRADSRYAGFIAEFHLTETPAFVRTGAQRVHVDNAKRYRTLTPHYAELLSPNRILRRDDVYGFGPPVDAHEDVLGLAAQLPSPILDFGCGNGDLVVKLRARGRDTHGIEIDRGPIRDSLKPDAAPFVKLYQGGLPLPYEDGAFAATVSSEVLEHVDDVEAYAADIARVTRSALFVTVPDMISIPFSHVTGTVPWHLLESTHVNFFTARSMTDLFAKWFRPVTYYRLANNYVNGRFVPGSVGILFERL